MSSTPPPVNNEKVLPRLVEDEMRDSFLAYSMSVICAVFSRHGEEDDGQMLSRSSVNR